MKRIIETERLYLRELIKNDNTDLGKVLCDPQSMKYYPAPFSDQKVNDWISWNIENYRKYNHGLWAVILKKEKIFLGDCGITIQEIEGNKLPELGYHINRKYWGRGYATEAAGACIDYAFSHLGYDTLYSYTKHDNIPSIRIAEKCGMTFVKEFCKEVMGESVLEYLYCISR